MRHPAFPQGVDRQQLIDWFRDGRRRTAEVFAIPTPEAYYDRPIKLRNPIVFYEGHLPAFNINTLIKLTRNQPGVDEEYEVLFARGIDPETEDAAKSPTDLWPSRQCVQKYGRTADARIEEELSDDEGSLTILEHEQMHQETLLYMFHEMAYERKIAREPLSQSVAALRSPLSAPATRFVPAGDAIVGARDVFGWDNEFPQHRIHVDAFEIDTFNVTNGQYLDYMRSTGAPPPHFWTERDGEWFWRGMFELIPLPHDWPVYVTHDEAAAYAKGRGARLPSEAEYQRAYGERMYPWGDEPPDATRGNFGFANWDPVPVGSYPDGVSPWGVYDLVGNGWEWTSTVFAGFDGFQPMKSYPVYSSDFFDGQHYVLKGASPATAPQLIRSSFRNWFRPNYPYVYATFRCVR